MHISSELDVDVIANTIGKGQKTDSGSDPYWDDMAEMLLKALIYYLIAKRPEEEKETELPENNLEEPEESDCIRVLIRSDDFVSSFQEKVTVVCLNASVVQEEDGSREYTIQIHHKRIDRLDAGEKILLLNELAAIRFGDDQCIILHKFLTYEG